MRYLLVFGLFLGVFSQVSGQGGLDTLGLTGTMADTAVADRLFTEMLGMINQRKWAAAEATGENAKLIFERILGKESKKVSNVLNARGYIYEQRGMFDSSIYYYQQFLDIRLKIYGDDHIETAAAFNNLGNAYDGKGLYNKALSLKQKALELRIKFLEPNHLDIAWSYNNVGNTYGALGDYNKAIENLQKSLEIRIKVLDADHPDIGFSYMNLGTAYYNSGYINKSVDFRNRALDIFKGKFGEIHPATAMAYNNLGNSYIALGEYDLAIELHNKSLNIKTELWGRFHPDVAASNNNLASVYDYKGDYKKSIYFRQEAIEIRLKMLGDKHPAVASAYYGMGITLKEAGEYEKALEYFKRSFEIRVLSLGENHPETANSYLSLASISKVKGEFEKAQNYYEKALVIYRNSQGPAHNNIAMTYNNLGDLYNYMKMFNESINVLDSSSIIYENNLDSKHPELMGPLNNLGVAYCELGNYNKALECYNRSLDIKLISLPKGHPYITAAYNNNGALFTRMGNYDNALQAYNNALESLSNGYKSEIFNVEQRLLTIKGLCELNRKEYNTTHDRLALTQAHLYAFQALEVLDFQYANLTDESKSLWQSQNYPIYEQAISVSLLKADVDKNDTLRHNTFTYAEKSKAALLQAQIKAADALAFAGIPDSLLELEHKLRIDISWREKQRQGLLEKGLAETDTNVLRIGGIVFDLKQQYEALKKRFETEYPEYYRLKYDLSTVSLSYVQDTLLQKDQALLEYFTGDSSIFLFVVRPDTMIVREVKRDFPLEDWIEGLRYGIYGYYAADKAVQTDALKADAKRNYLEFAPKLYQKLVAPVVQHLPEKVILVPDGPLGYIPFDALLTAAPEDANDFKSYPYLIQQHQFSYTYSATLLREMRDKKHRREPEYDFVAFAPFYNGDTTLLAGMYSYDDLMRKDLQPLAFSGPEVAAASKLMRGETVAGAAATEARFTATAGNYRILHLATHGRADNRVGDYAFLAFTEIKDSLENELLYVKDLYNLQLNADLVVLSACETGIGKLQRGEGIISLARAFAYAGAKSIVTSLWSVNDKSTSELMRFFYRELRRGKDKDEALRLARQRFLKESSVKNSHPFFWAAFVPLGDMRGVK